MMKFFHNLQNFEKRWKLSEFLYKFRETQNKNAGKALRHCAREKFRAHPRGDRALLLLNS